MKKIDVKTVKNGNDSGEKSTCVIRKIAENCEEKKMRNETKVICEECSEEYLTRSRLGLLICNNCLNRNYNVEELYQEQE